MTLHAGMEPARSLNEGWERGFAAGYAAAREQAAKIADKFDELDCYDNGEIGSAIRAMSHKDGEKE